MEEYKVEPQSAVISMFKIFTVKRTYGHKLTGIRCYDCENRVVLSVGWFQDADCKKIELKPTQRVTGIEGVRH